MLCNARIRDSKGGRRKEKLQPKKKEWKVKRTRAPELSPFSELVLGGERREPSLCRSPTFGSPSPCSDESPELRAPESIDAVTTRLHQCRLQDSEPAAPNGLPRQRIAPSTEFSSASDVHSVRPVSSGRRSLKEVHLSKENGQKSGAAAKHAEENVTSPQTPSVPHSPPATSPFSLRDCPRVNSPLLHYLSPAHALPLSPRQKVLALCEQTEPLPLEDFFSNKMVSSVEKLGEGTFAEVFGSETELGESLAIKIIPIEGDFDYNDEPQSTFSEVLTEMVVIREVGLLGEESNKENSLTHFTEGFMHIKRMALCAGQYPSFLIRAWETFYRSHSSQNDRPDIFPSDQLYIVVATENAGTALEEYEFASPEEALSVLVQVAGALAVGEAALEMEHRDLHWSNVLVRGTAEQHLLLRLEGKEYLVPSHGVKATVVDYTLSRIKQDDCVSYNDLNRLPWLFEGKGDIQYEVYRGMKRASSSNWERYTPYTNILWLNYLVNKLHQDGKHSATITARTWRSRLRPFLRTIQSYPSALEAFVDVFAPAVLS